MSACAVVADARAGRLRLWSCITSYLLLSTAMASPEGAMWS